MSGASPEKIKHALNTHENVVGPGQYEPPQVLGGNVPNAKTRNFPSYSIGHPRLPNVLNPGTRKTIGMKGANPPPNAYNHKHDNINFHKNDICHKWEEGRFFEQSNMPKIK